jgi:predicted secreted hydrolase
MKNRLAAVALLSAVPLSAATGELYRKALPGYQFQFPRDHFNHEEFRTEWWYYTGNLRAEDGRRFGFELTFFRHGINRDQNMSPNVWDVQDVWLAHFALSDIDGRHFYHTERLNRAGAGMAGADAGRALVWNGNWQVQWQLEGRSKAGFSQKKLRAIADSFAVELSMRSGKAPVIHGTNGVSQKSAGAGRASHYISLTRLNTEGKITVEGKEFVVEGLAWMDHEFFTHSLESNQSGWDWFSLQFEDGSELMLYRLRRKDGTAEPYSSGTYVDAQGRARHLSLDQYQMEPLKIWTSPATGAKYPIAWSIRVPSIRLEASVQTALAQQELVGKLGEAPTYWEGAIDVSGTRDGKPLRGQGYLELTGYAGAVRMGE